MIYDDQFRHPYIQHLHRDTAPQLFGYLQRTLVVTPIRVLLLGLHSKLRRRLRAAPWTYIFLLFPACGSGGVLAITSLTTDVFNESPGLHRTRRLQSSIHIFFRVHHPANTQCVKGPSTPFDCAKHYFKPQQTATHPTIVALFTTFHTAVCSYFAEHSDGLFGYSCTSEDRSDDHSTFIPSKLPPVNSFIGDPALGLFLAIPSTRPHLRSVISFTVIRKIPTAPTAPTPIAQRNALQLRYNLINRFPDARPTVNSFLPTTVDYFIPLTRAPPLGHFVDADDFLLPSSEQSFSKSRSLDNPYFDILRMLLPKSVLSLSALSLAGNYSNIYPGVYLHDIRNNSFSWCPFLQTLFWTSVNDEHPNRFGTFFGPKPRRDTDSTSIMVPPPEAYDWSNVYGIEFKFQSDNNPREVLSLNGSYAETVPLTAPEISTLFTSDANDEGPRTLGPAPVTALREAFCKTITLDMATNIDELAKGHIAQLLDSCPVRFVKPGFPNQRIRNPQDFDSVGREAVRRAEATNDPAPLATVIFNINQWNPSVPLNTAILTVPITPVKSEAHTAIQLIDSDVVTAPSNTTTSVPPVTANLGSPQPVGPIADTPSVKAPCYIWTWTYSPHSESVSFHRVNSISFRQHASSPPNRRQGKSIVTPVQRQDKFSPVTTPSVSPSARPRFGHHSAPPCEPPNS
eukprot:jgi/Psemu1/55188/gm1.55188_g